MGVEAFRELETRAEGIIARFHRTLSAYDVHKEAKAGLEVSIETSKKELEDLKNLIILQDKSIELCKEAVEYYTGKAKGRVTQLIKGGLVAIFYDRQLDFKIEIGNRGASKTARFLMSEGSAPFRDVYSHGAGFTSVVAMLLRIHFIMEMGYPRYLILDEAMTRISDIYVDGFFEFLNKVIKSLGFEVLFITHDPRFVEYGDAIYSFIRPGIIKKVSTLEAVRIINRKSEENPPDSFVEGE